ncbi:DUF1840 domain-containing protein [Rubrivivax gelatinosus]|uniref:Uncharacterized protein DUF1840 n=1 Tax=Rubrivivax gelatinosus TaxID=28068 RepID=A0A4R2M944_RUBGE|nr:DUF1840 domain-containing protein [Rubrivivax gelatinosus]MBK1686501.1 hypothetical protein [Rubrivivax gelatinosus]TCP00967.1 uncharacterized protein DUF1840 [Rubrivivax gelatinosus]
MIYKFKSQATGDLIMLGPHGDRVLRLLGREPAPQGIIEVGAMAAAIAALEQAAAEDDEARREAGSEDPGEAARVARQVSLRSRVWPMIQMLRRAHEAGEPIVWGV